MWEVVALVDVADGVIEAVVVESSPVGTDATRERGPVVIVFPSPARDVDGRTPVGRELRVVEERGDELESLARGEDLARPRLDVDVGIVHSAIRRQPDHSARELGRRVEEVRLRRVEREADGARHIEDAVRGGDLVVRIAGAGRVVLAPAIEFVAFERDAAARDLAIPQRSRELELSVDGVDEHVERLRPSKFSAFGPIRRRREGLKTLRRRVEEAPPEVAAVELQRLHERRRGALDAGRVPRRVREGPALFRSERLARLFIESVPRRVLRRALGGGLRGVVAGDRGR
mmetsp:Transcript_5556/g.23072  ORF Transcript_5556/g.23072 Transcript_5556/m.23072 type:complete len:288 (+) Transcript_5556:1106-1969(+)